MSTDYNPDDYSIDLADVEAYLSTLASDQRCGDSRSACHCPVSEALKYKYGGIPFVVNGLRFWPLDARESFMGDGRDKLPLDVAALVEGVDTNWNHRHTVTRQELEGILHNIKESSNG